MKEKRKKESVVNFLERDLKIFSIPAPMDFEQPPKVKVSDSVRQRGKGWVWNNSICNDTNDYMHTVNWVSGIIDASNGERHCHPPFHLFQLRSRCRFMHCSTTAISTCTLVLQLYLRHKSRKKDEECAASLL
jgi:hypothetical protein